MLSVALFIDILNAFMLRVVMLGVAFRIVIMLNVMSPVKQHKG
jgi:hypothetical protein